MSLNRPTLSLFSTLAIEKKVWPDEKLGSCTMSRYSAWCPTRPALVGKSSHCPGAGLDSRTPNERMFDDHFDI